MGPCQSQSKLKSRKDLQQPTLIRKTDQVLTNNNPSLNLPSFSPNQEVNSEPYDDTKKNLSQLKVYRFSYKQFYSEITQGNMRLQLNQKLVQHNLTGKIRVVEQYERNQQNEEFISQLKRYPLDNPRIVTVHELFIVEEYYHLIVDYCSGGQLSNYYVDKSIIPFTEAEIASIIYQAAESLRYLEQIGLTHGFLDLNSFSRVDMSHHFQIKLSDIRGLFVKPNLNRHNVFSLPPEACIKKDQSEFDHQRDLWSLGVMAYQMICGYPPFEGNTIESVKSQIKKMAAQYNNFQFDRVSKLCRQLIQRVLVPAKQRISLQAFMNDQWFKIRTKQNDQNLLTKLQQNKVKVSELQQLFLIFIIKNICSADQQQLYTEFANLDENQDGQLTKDEILRVYSNRFDSKADAKLFIENIFKIADVDKSGTIDFGEFLVAITDKSGLLTEENLKTTFKMVASSNGKLTTQKLRFHFNTSVSKLDKLFLENFNNPQNVGYSEFEALMKQLL
ncbi:unnamed protein product (macronuclear) [Paramecium tetraurelia]|uniref:Protein kinase domain containing protein n=1 Tax=Paramecium tetraurelia TaxID=5888 RepID=A0CG37_PARTE|nr:uncharacterized protein GSPATT00038198001 [Paramecium tetraurelia]CAK69754.1 unnamed protein product [Paramecium tetraurelia]|eukprot:XP_001437151.1 hypothetical protein (macronuclear) [Paramecium tetraurelia strain d4-2]